MKLSRGMILSVAIATMSLAGCSHVSTARPSPAPIFLPPLAPEIREPCAPPVASRNPQVMADRAIDAYGVCNIKHAGTVAADDQVVVELGQKRK